VSLSKYNNFIFFNSLEDIFTSITHYNLWLYLGIRDLSLEHARAFLGILWPMIGAFAWITIVYLFMGPSLSGGNINYLAYVSIGIVIYNFASGILIGGVSCFFRYKGIILNIPNPLFIYPLRTLTKVSAGVFLQITFIAISLLLCDIKPQIEWFFIIPSLLCYLITGVFLILIMGIIGVRVGDLRFMMQSIMRLLMFATPIFWYPAESGVRMIATVFNPLAHYIAIIRNPLMGIPIDILSIYVVVCCTLSSILIGLILFRNSRNNIVRML
jgi:ABC-type polysaccharide/polyol phosphate export permease